MLVKRIKKLIFECLELIFGLFLIKLIRFFVYLNKIKYGWFLDKRKYFGKIDWK